MITIKNLSKNFGDVTAVSNINLTINEGEFVTILGPSGSGKTTLLTLIAGFEEPTEGEIFINDVNVINLPTDKRNIGLVFQSYALFPHMNVYENIAFPLTVRRLSKSQIKEKVFDALEKVRLEKYAERKIHELSGGQQQRVALARAFVFEPSILLLDEPMAALDRKLRQELQIELRDLQRSLGITTISVTHDQEEALTMSDKILILNEGRIEQYGKSEDLYRKPANRFVANFLGTSNIFNGEFSINDEKEVFVIESGEEIECMNSGYDHGDVAQLMVRPEHIKLFPQTSNEKGISGIVKSVIYLGSNTRYHIQIANNQMVIVNETSYQIRFSEGDQVKLSWDPQVNWFLHPIIQKKTSENLAV